MVSGRLDGWRDGLSQFDLGRGNDARVERLVQDGHPGFLRGPAMVLERPTEGRLAGHVTREAKALGVESGRERYGVPFGLRAGGLEFEVLAEDLAAAAMDDARRGPDFLIGKPGDILLEEIHEPSFALEGAEEQESRGVKPLGGRRGGRRQLGGRGGETGGSPPGKLAVEKHPERQPKPPHQGYPFGGIVFFHAPTIA